MKKALSLILALIMVFALATTAFASEKNVVGNGPGGIGVDPEDFDENTQPDVNVNINVSAVGTVHKYAVDVSWSDEPIALGGGTMTWNVQTMKYDTADTPTGNAPKTWDITITNYSDLPVYAYAGIEDKIPADHMTITPSHTNESRLTVARATAATGDETQGNATEGTITITLAPETGKDWADVVEYYTINHAGETSVLAATATVRIAKNDYVAP